MSISEVEEEDEGNILDFGVPSQIEDIANSPTHLDDFNSEAALLKSMNLSPSLKKKISRLEKRSTGNGVESKRLNPIQTAYSLFDVVPIPYLPAMLAGLYEQNSWHSAAVDAKTYNAVALGHTFEPTPATVAKLDELEGKGEKLAKFRRKLESVRQEHEVWLDSLNDEDSFTETLIKVHKDYEVFGNGYLEVGRTPSGQIAYLGHVPAIGVRVRRLRDGFIQMVNTNKAVFFRNYGDSETKNPLGNDPNPSEIIHFKKYTPTNDFYGAPDIIPAIGAILGTKYATLFNIDYFDNKAVPRYVVVVKGATLSKNAERSVYEFFDAKLKGKHHRTLYIPLPNDDPERKIDFDIKPVEAGIQDASFIKYKDSNRDEILGAHRVPITKVLLAPGLSLAAARDADKTFKEQVTRPQQDLFEKKINRIVAEKSEVFSLKLNELSLTDEDTQSKIDERYLRMQVYTPNEVRARKGLPGLDGGDKVIDLNAQRSAEQASEARGNDSRARERSANASDSAGEARNEQGAGRQAK